MRVALCRAHPPDPMTWKNTPARYGSVSIALHWLMLVLVVAVCLLMELKSITPKGSAQRALMAKAHYTLGLSVFVLTWLRLAMRLAGSTPLVQPPMSATQARLARGMHLALYALMVLLPLLGWLTLSAKAQDIPFFGTFLPPLVGESTFGAKWFKEFHETGATIGYLLVGGHALAAIYHHVRVRDNTLRLMLPGRGGAG